jgi:tetratricopeptide (TPR) repeat protein
MVQLALMSDNFDLADDQAKSLALLAPDNPVVTLVGGYDAYRSGDNDKAEAAADSILANSPDDSFAKVLKAKVLVGRGRFDEAASLLEAQHQITPDDQGALRGLTAIYQFRDDWRNLARIQTDARRLKPRDFTVAVAAIDAWLRAGNVAAASQLSRPYLVRSSNPRVVESVLDSWATHAPPGAILPDAVKLASALSGDARVSFGNYFNRVRRPDLTAALLGGSRLPVTQANARLNAVVAQSIALRGNSAAAKRLFDLVLEREPDQAEALRGRCALEASNGMTKQAIIDAERLVTISPNSAEDRLLLAHANRASGNNAEALRTLWQAFQDLPGDEQVFSSLRSALASTGDLDGQRRVDDEFADRRKAKLTKDLV